jgi:F0F1-type ATP synthase membrane subunit b/b'
MAWLAVLTVLALVERILEPSMSELQRRLESLAQALSNARERSIQREQEHVADLAAARAEAVTPEQLAAMDELKVIADAILPETPPA